MKKIFYGFLALAGLAMVSCSQEIDEQINANTDSVKKIFTANTEDGASTRTSIALEEQTGNYVVIWNGEELIAVNGVDYKVTDGAGTKTVTFGANVEGTEAATAEVYNAVYPNNAWVEGGLDLEHLKEQTAMNATYGHGYAVTVATTTSSEMDFKFKNALSFLRVRFTLAEDAKEDAITIKTVKITANDNLWGTVSEVNYTTGEIGAVANDSELGKSIVYTAGEDVLLDRGENAIFDAVIAVPVNTEGRTLTIEITGENAWTGIPYTYKAEGVTKKYLRNNVTTLAKAIKPVEIDQVFVSNFEQLQAAVDAITTANEVIINLAAGQYVGALDVTGGKNIVLQPAVEGAEVVLAGLDHQSNGNPSTVVVNKITFDNSIEIEGWFTGTAQNIKPCVGFWGGNLTFNECVFNVTGASGAETGIMSWWTTTPAANLTLNECTFNGDNSSARAAQIYGNVNVTATECVFNTAKEYAIKLALEEGNKAVLSNNSVENAQIFVRLGSAPYAGNNYKVTFTNNTLASGIALYDVDNYENQTVVEGTETKFYAADTEGIRSYLNGAASPANIYLGAKAYTMATDYSLAFEGTVNLFGAGMAKTTLSFSSTPGGANGGLNAYANHASLYFKDMKVVSPNTGSSYTGGFAHAANVKFDSCHYVGQWRSNSPTQFVGCTIDPQTSYIYTDYYDVTFDSCTFNASEGKAIQVYNDGNTTETTITINNTTFTAAKQAATWDGKPVTAIDINSNGEKFTVNITESSATGFGTGLQSGNDFWNIKGGEANVVINIDGEKVWPVEMTPVANVNGVEYKTLAEAINAADGATVTLTKDVVLAEYLDIPAGANVTLDLNGNNITTTSENKYVLSNENGGSVTINGNGGSMTGRIYNTGGEMVINGGTFYNIEGDKYALMNSTNGKLTVTDATVNCGSGSTYGIFGYNANNEVILNDVTVNGTFGALNSYGEGAKMTVNGGTYAMTGIEGTTSHIAYFATESTIVINGGTFKKIGEVSLSGEGGGGICVNGGADLTINDGIFAGDYSDVYNWGGEGTTITIKGGNYKFNPTASFIAKGYKVTENANGTFTVAMTPVAALNKQIADGASTITLTEDVVFEEGETLTIPAGKTVTLDLAGYTMSQEMTCTGSYVMVSNNGTLTIKDSGENGTIIMTDNGDGDSTFGWGSYTVRNNGTLTIDGGTIKNVKRADVAHCAVTLMLYAGKATINDGNIISANYRTIQGFSTPEVIINGGNFEGQVWMHSTCSAEASLTINGGTFAPRGTDGSSVFLNNDKDIKLAITGGNFTTKVGCNDATKAGVAGAIKGGTFTEAAMTSGATAALVAEGYKAVENNDGTYTVKLKPAVLRINNMNGWGDLKVTIKSGATTVVNAQAMTKDGDTNVFYYEFDASYIGKEVSYFLTHSWYQTSTKTVTVTADTEAIKLHTTYLEPGTWDWTSATFGAWFFNGNGESDTMVTGVKVKDNFFEFEIPSTTYKNVIFVRCNNNNATASWDTKWNQTSDLTLKNECYCVDTWTQGDLDDTQWF